MIYKINEDFKKAAVSFVDKTFKNNPYTYWEKINRVFRGDFKNYEDVPKIEQYI